MALLPIAIIVCFLPIIHSNSFQTHCTLPGPDANYVSGPDVRSTLQIFWSSIVTIFLCTWTVLHLNIPDQSPDNRPQASDIPFQPLGDLAPNTAQALQSPASDVHSQQPKSSTSRRLRSFRRWLSRKPKWMLVTIILPEFLVGKSLADFVAAWRSTRCNVMRQRAKDAGIEWTMTHAYYANMGGFILKDGSDLCESCRKLIMSQRLNSRARFSSNSIQCHHSPSHAPTISSLPQAEAQPSRRFTPPSEYHEDLKAQNSGYARKFPHPMSSQLPIAVRAMDLCVLLSSGTVEGLPSITKDHINSQSKEDALVKLLTLIQVLWLFVQLVVRKLQGLPSTQLEVSTLSYAICTFITYIFWLQKPKDLVSTTEVITTRALSGEDKAKLGFMAQQGFFTGLLYLDRPRPLSTYIPNDAYNPEASFGYLDSRSKLGSFYFGAEDIGFIFGAIVLGSAHLIAWNFQFPTMTEQVLWRIATLITISIILLWYIIWILLIFSGCLIEGINLADQDRAAALLRKVITGFASTVYLIYGLCRVFILAECFRGLFYSPPYVFKATWTELFPRFS